MAYINEILAIGIALVLGLLSTRLMKLIGMPNVTGYLIVGLIIGPHCLGLIQEGVLENLGVISSIALGFIAFSIGVEFKLKHIREIGKSAMTITFFQAFAATLFVDGILIATGALTKMPLYEAIILGAIATATAPAATLMVVRQYKAKGIVTGTLLPVVALDDAVGLIVFAISNAIALALVSGAQITVMTIAVWPLVEIVASLVIGGAVGCLLSVVPRFFRSRDNRLISTIVCVFLCIGICELFNVLNSEGKIPFALSDLLVCMMAGAIFVNLRKEADTIMEGTDRWTPALFMLFFILSGAELNVMTFVNRPELLIVLALYIVARCAGKYLGAFAGAAVSKSDRHVRNYLGITLFPQAGVAIGMATMCGKEFSKAAATASPELAPILQSVGTNIVTITMCAVLVYELVGPLLTKWALVKAGEIDPSMLNRRKKAKAAAAAGTSGTLPAGQSGTDGNSVSDGSTVTNDNSDGKEDKGKK